MGAGEIFSLSISRNDVEKIAKKYSGSSYKGATTSSDATNVFMDVTFVKKDGSEETTRLIFNKPKNGAELVSADIVNKDIVYTLSDGKKITLTDAMVVLKGEQGVQGIQGIKGDKGDKGDIGLTPKAEWQGTSLGFDNGAKVDLKGEKGDKIKHRWKGTKLELENPDGTFDTPVDLLGKSYNPRGNYDPNTQYDKLDVIAYLNNVFVVLNDGIMGATPPTTPNSNNNYGFMFTSTVTDTSSILNNSQISTSTGWTSSKIKSELDAKAEKVNVLQINVDNPTFTPQKDNDPVTKKYADTVSSIDNIKDSSNKVVMTKGERDKLANLQDTTLPPRQTLAALKQEYPDGKDTPKEGTMCYIVDSKGDGTNVGSYFSYTLKVWKNMNTGSLDLETWKKIYDVNSIGKDIFNMDNHVESARNKHFTIDEKEKLKDLGVHKLDGFEVDGSERADSKLLVLNGTDNKFEYKPFIDIKDVASFTGDRTKRIAWRTNPIYNQKFMYIYLDETDQNQYLWHKPSQNFLQYEGQDLDYSIAFPNNPTANNFTAQGKDASYVWDDTLKAWMVTTVKSKVEGIKRTTWGEYGVWVDNATNLSQGIFYIMETGQLIDYTNGIGVESSPNRSAQKRPTLTSDKTKPVIDDVGNMVYQWSEQFKYWKITVDSYVEVLSPLDGATAETTFNLSDSSTDYDKLIFKYVESENAMEVSLGTTRERQYFKSILNAKNVNSVLQKSSGFCNASNTLSIVVLRVDGIEGELMITSEKSKGTGMSFRFNFIKIRNGIFITSKQVVDMEKLADLPLTGNFTTLAERKAKTLKTPTFMREFWDNDLGAMLILNHQGIWRDYNDKYETITFPINPTDKQEFTSNLGDKYTYDLPNVYWKLTRSSVVSITVKDAIQITRGSSQFLNSGSRWDCNTIVSQIGTGLTMENGGVKLKANTSYKLQAQLSFYTADTSSQFATYGFYNATKSSWLRGSNASMWGSSWTYQPNRTIDAIYTTGSTDEIIDIRCGYYGFATVDKVSILGFNSIGTGTNGNNGGTSFFTVEAIDAYQQKLLPLEGTYVDFVHVGLSATPIVSMVNGTMTYQVPFDKVLFSSGTNIVNNNNGTFTLKKGYSYEIEADLVIYSYGGRANWSIFSNTDNANVGLIGGGGSTTTNTGMMGNSKATYTFTPNIDTTISCRIIWADTTTNAQIYQNSNGASSSYLKIRCLGTTKVYVDSNTTVLSKQNYATVNNISPVNGDFWYDGNDFICRSRGTNVNLTSFEDLCIVNYGFGFGNFAGSAGSVANEFNYKDTPTSIASTSQVAGNASNNPTWNGNGTWTLPKGLWRVSWWWDSTDSPDGANDFAYQTEVLRNGQRIYFDYMNKSSNVNDMNFDIGGEVTTRSNGTTTLKFNINAWWYSGANVLRIQFERLL